jgi:hypothetical protein
MMEQALEDFGVEHGVNFEKISTIPLEGEGTIEKRVERCASFDPQRWLLLILQQTVF